MTRASVSVRAGMRPYAPVAGAFLVGGASGTGLSAPVGLVRMYLGARDIDQTVAGYWSQRVEHTSSLWHEELPID